MEKTVERKPKSVQYYARTLHSVLGYLAVGLVIVFSLSGIILVHRTGGLMKHTERVELTIQPGLNVEQLASALKLKKLDNAVTEGDMIRFAEGEYNIANGEVSYERKEVVAPFNRFINLHKISDGKDKGIAWFVTTFGIVLFLLAVTSLFMYGTKSKKFKRNMLYTAIGIILAVALVCVV